MIAAFLAPYLLRIIAGGVIIAAIGGGFLYFKIHYEHIGRDKEAAAIAAKNQGAAENVKAAIRNVDECEAAGRTWDVTVLPHGMCLE